MSFTSYDPQLFFRRKFFIHLRIMVPTSGNKDSHQFNIIGFILGLFQFLNIEHTFQYLPVNQESLHLFSITCCVIYIYYFMLIAQSAGAVEYIDCTSTEE